jgi:hypothetical protein
MTDPDEDGRRIPDYDELADAYEERQRRRWGSGCLCGYPDLPGRCPGPANCPMHGEPAPTEETP